MKERDEAQARAQAEVRKKVDQEQARLAGAVVVDEATWDQGGQVDAEVKERDEAQARAQAEWRGSGGGSGSGRPSF